jgi:hypothetical protein
MPNKKEKQRGAASPVKVSLQKTLQSKVIKELAKNP